MDSHKLNDLIAVSILGLILIGAVLYFALTIPDPESFASPAEVPTTLASTDSAATAPVMVAGIGGGGGGVRGGGAGMSRAGFAGPGIGGPPAGAGGRPTFAGASSVSGGPPMGGGRGPGAGGGISAPPMLGE